MPELRKHGLAAGTWFGEELYVTVGRPELVLHVEDVRRTRDGGQIAQILAVDSDTGAQAWGTVQLVSHRSRDEFCKAMAAAKIPVPPNAFGDACRLIYDMVRDGQPAVRIEAPEPDSQPEVEWFVPGWMQRGQTTVLYGDGDAGKSGLALAVAVAALTKSVAGPWRPQPAAAVLYLDWETDARTIQRRVQGYIAPSNLAWPTGLHYRRMDGPLADDLRAVRHLIAEHHVELVIVDSMSPASGGEAETAEAALRINAALRRLGVTVIVVAHVSHGSAQMTSGFPRPYGSVYNRNLPRSTIFVGNDETDDRLVRVLTCTHTKCNDGPKQAPIGVRVTHDEQGFWTVTVSEPDVSRFPKQTQAMRLLVTQGPKNTEEIADYLDVTVPNAKQMMHRMMRRGDVVPFDPERRGGRGKQQVWAAAERRR